MSRISSRRWVFGLKTYASSCLKKRWQALPRWRAGEGLAAAHHVWGNVSRTAPWLPSDVPACLLSLLLLLAPSCALIDLLRLLLAP